MEKKILSWVCTMQLKTPQPYYIFDALMQYVMPTVKKVFSHAQQHNPNHLLLSLLLMYVTFSKINVSYDAGMPE